MPLISVIVVISASGRENELDKLARSLRAQTLKDFELIVVENGITFNDKIERIFSGLNIGLVKSETNRGVAGGRNIGIKKTTGRFFVFIDDDAYFDSPEALQKIVDSFNKHKSAGVLSFKIETITADNKGQKTDHGGYPVRRGTHIDSDTKCSYFFGGASAFKRDIIDNAGLLPEEYFFGCEELDYSFRLMAKEIDIYFIPDIIIKHCMSTSGKPAGQRSYYLIKNRINVAFKYLPVYYAVIHSMLWTLFIFQESVRTMSVNHYLRGLLHGIKNIPKARSLKCTLDKKTIKKINKLNGRTFY